MAGALAVLALAWPHGLLAQSRPEQPVFINPDLSVPETHPPAGANATFGTTSIDNSHLGPPLQPLTSQQGLYLGPSRSGEGKFFIYGESVQYVDERTGQAEKPSRKFGIKLNTRLRSR